jgi:hypothetical protein
LLYYSNDTVFDRFILYDKSYPKYASFYVGGNTEGDMMLVYELIPQGAIDTRSPIFALSEFTTQNTKELKDMVVVLLMESYVNDPDLCTGTDCDNLGQDCINKPKLLLVEKAAINSLLKPAIPTSDAAFSTLNEIVADRPIIPSSISSVDELTQIYRNVCTTIHNKLLAELPNLYLNSSVFLADVFASDPTNNWATQLTNIHSISSSDVEIQYYYDFLKDVVETYNQFRDLLFGDTTWCCPDINWFPKHLLLGNLVPDDDDSDENRTAFYPSSAVSQTTESLNHAKFLARKLDTLIQTFQIPAASADAPIRITPSLFEDQPLEERAIPYYYQVNTTNPIHKSWNYSLSQRGMGNRNYSYNATAYEAQGAAANPLGSQIGRFSFFRIEGHLGKNAETAFSSIESEIKSKNLPFTVRSVLLGRDKTKVVKKPGIRYTDLHRFHYLLRQDAYHQLNEVAQFSDKFKQAVDQNVTGESKANDFKRDAEQRNTIVIGKAASVATKLNRSYAEYKVDLSWQPELAETVTAASQFKFNIGDVVKTEFTTPFDTLIGSTHLQWLDWLDEIIKKKDEAEDEKLLFTNFISQNPGIEHFAGVIRGGTFVLVYDNSNTVVADFVLPYYCEDKVEAVPEEPPLTKPPIRPNFVVDRGIRVLPSIQKGLTDFIQAPEFNQRLVSFTQAPEFNQRLVNFTQAPEFNQKLDQQQKYLEIYQKYVDSTTNIFSNVSRTKLQGVDVVRFTNPELDLQVREAVLRREKVELVKQQINKPNLSDEERRVAQEKAQKAEVELAESLQKTADYIATSGINVSSGSEEFQAMLEVSNSIGTLSQEGEALKTLQIGLASISKQTQNAGLKVIIGNMLNR